MSARKEEWKDIPGYDGWYQASDWGRVQSFFRWGGHSSGNGRRAEKPRMVNIRQNSHGTAIVSLMRPDGSGYRSESLPHLMALTWIGKVPPGMVAYCRNGNQADNSRWNIVLRTKAEQITATDGIYRNGRRPVIKIDNTLMVVQAYGSATQAAKENGLDKSSILMRLNLKYKRSIFAPDGFLYAWDDSRSVWATIRRAMQELDELGLRYNNPFTGRYFDLPQDDDLDIDSNELWWTQALSMAEGQLQKDCGVMP